MEKSLEGDRRRRHNNKSSGSLAPFPHVASAHVALNFLPVPTTPLGTRGPWRCPPYDLQRVPSPDSHIQPWAILFTPFQITPYLSRTSHRAKVTKLSLTPLSYSYKGSSVSGCDLSDGDCRQCSPALWSLSYHANSHISLAQ
jgi:hypothetical protein